MNKISFSQPLTFEQIEGQKPKLTGYAIVFNSPSEDLGGYKVVVDQQTFSDQLLNPTHEILALVDHDMDRPIARRSKGTLQFSVDEKGVKVVIEPSETSWSKDAIEAVKHGDKVGMSFMVASPTFTNDRINGQMIKRMTSGVLKEFSVVTDPAFQETTINTFKKEKKETPSKTINNKQETKVMNLNWNSIKAVEEETKALFAKATDLSASAQAENRELTEEESAQYDNLLSERDSKMEQFEDLKGQYFSKAKSMNVITQKNQPKVEMKNPYGFTHKDLGSYSLLRAIAKKMNNEPLDGLEKEVSDEIARFSGRDARGFYFPTHIGVNPAAFALTTTTGSGAVETPLLTGSFIELLRANSMLPALGVTMLDGLVGNTAIPKQTGGATAYWVSEGNAPTASNQVVGQVSLTPKTVGAYTDITRKMILQTSLSVEQLVRNDLARTIALEIDRAALQGSGASNQPTGLLTNSSVTNVAFSGSLDFTKVVALETTVANSKVDLNGAKYLSDYAVKGKLKVTNEFTDTSAIWHNDNTINGYGAVASSNLGYDDEYGGASRRILAFGQWRDLIVGMWSGLDILVDPYTGSNAGTVRIVAFQDADVAVRHAESFAYYDDIVL